MSTSHVNNWFGGITSSPSTVIEVRTVEEIIAIVTDEEKYPAPVRAVGSNHSTTACGTADDGTLIVTRKMDRIIDIGDGHGDGAGGRALHRRERGAAQARAPVLRQRRARQPDHRQCLLRRHQGRLDGRRVRPDRLVRSRHQDGAAERRAVRGRRERPGAAPGRPLQLRPVRDRLRSHLPRAQARRDAGAPREVHPRGVRRAAARAPCPRRLVDALHQPVQGHDHRRVPPLPRDRLRLRT